VWDAHQGSRSGNCVSSRFAAFEQRKYTKQIETAQRSASHRRHMLTSRLQTATLGWAARIPQEDGGIKEINFSSGKVSPF